jgi:ATP synthase F1 delta subunit
MAAHNHINYTIAKRYAEALLADLSANDRIALERDLHNFLDFFQTRQLLLKAMANPLLNEVDRLALITSVSKQLQLGEMLSSYLRLIAKRKRLPYLWYIITYTQQLNWRQQHIYYGTLWAVSKPNQQFIDRIQEALGQLLKGKAELTVMLQEELIQGFVVQIGSHRFDGSLQNVLAKVNRFANERKW